MMSIAVSFAASRRTSCSRCWSASAGSSLQLDRVLALGLLGAVLGGVLERLGGLGECVEREGRRTAAVVVIATGAPRDEREAAEDQQQHDGLSCHRTSLCRVGRRVDAPLGRCPCALCRKHAQTHGQQPLSRACPVRQTRARHSSPARTPPAGARVVRQARRATTAAWAGSATGAASPAASAGSVASTGAPSAGRGRGSAPVLTTTTCSPRSNASTSGASPSRNRAPAPRSLPQADQRAHERERRARIIDLVGDVGARGAGDREPRRPGGEAARSLASQFIGWRNPSRPWRSSGGEAPGPSPWPISSPW